MAMAKACCLLEAAADMPSLDALAEAVGMSRYDFHRVVRHDGTLSGYRWGVERRRALLDREAAP